MVIINMLCQYCQVLAEFVCKCSMLLCKGHSVTHLKSCKSSGAITRVENTKIDFSIDISERIKKINKACCDVVEKTSGLVRRIKSLCNISIRKLEKLKENYMSMLESGLTKNQLEFMKVKQVKFPEITKIEKFYNEKFIID